MTHEISIAFSFVPTLTRNTLASNEEPERKPIEGTFVADIKESKKERKSKLDAKTTLRPTNKEDLAFWEAQVKELKAQQDDNYAVINELIFKMDSMENNRQRDLEKRFEMVMRMVKRQTDNKIPDIEANAQKLYLANSTDLDSLNKVMKNTSLAENTPTPKKVKPKGTFTGGAYKPIEKFINLDGVGKGHYIVANVFKNERYLKGFISDLKKRGLDAKYFKNPDNGLNYVYLAKYEQNEKAYAAYQSQMKGEYTDELWIMHVDNPRYSNWADTKFQDNE